MPDSYSDKNEIEIDRIMEKIREEVQRRRGETDMPSHHYEPVSRENAFIDTSEIRTIISSAESNADIGLRTPKMLQFRGITRKLALFTGKKILYLSTFITTKQRYFNTSVIHALKKLTDNLQVSSEEIGLLKNEITTIQKTADEFRSQLSQAETISRNTADEFRSQLSQVETNSRNTADEIRNQLSQTKAEAKNTTDEIRNQLSQTKAEAKNTADEIRNQLSQVETNAKNTADEFRNQLNQTEADVKSTAEEFRNQLNHTEAVLNEETIKRDTRIEDLNKTITYLKYTITMLERRISILLEKAENNLSDTSSAQEIKNIIKEKDHLLDALYVSFEDQFRGTREDIKKRTDIYLPYIKEVNAGTKDSLVLDVGCGRGEWLELLKEKGFEARGVDINSVLVKECRDRKLEVIENEVILYLRTLPDTSIGAITGLHIIEHLPFETLIKLLDETTRVLKEGGIAIFETPNPNNVLVGSCNFYLDPTHRKPLPSQMIKFMAEARGLSSVKILGLHPCNEAIKLSGSDLAERFNEYFYGPQDYAVIGYKR